MAPNSPSTRAAAIDVIRCLQSDAAKSFDEQCDHIGTQQWADVQQELMD